MDAGKGHLRICLIPAPGFECFHSFFTAPSEKPGCLRGQNPPSYEYRLITRLVFR